MKAGFCSECGENVYLDDAGNCSKGHPATSVRDIYDVQEAPAAPTSAISAPGVPLHKRKWFLPVAMLLLGLMLGIGMGSSSSGDTDTPDLRSQVSSLEAKVDELTTERDALEAERDDLEEQLDPIKRAEDEAAAAAKAEADAAAKAQADADAAAAAATAAAAAEAAANTFRSGVYLVGTDMKAGRYKGAPTSDMGYWAVLADANGADIIENNIVEGPFYVEVRDGQYLELSDVEITLVQ